MSKLSAARIKAELVHAAPRNVAAWRELRRGWSRELKPLPAANVIEIAERLLDVEPWGRASAYELIAYHPCGIEALTPASIDRLARGLSDWEGVDTLGCYLAGPAWREGNLPTRHVHAWLRSKDRWQRRLAVVCTVALNVRARGGRGDVERTLAVCRRVVTDRDDMVVKALSWALRSLVEHDRGAVAGFLSELLGNAVMALKCLPRRA